MPARSIPWQIQSSSDRVTDTNQEPTNEVESCVTRRKLYPFKWKTPVRRVPAYDVRFPMILPQGHCVTKLIVKHYHEQANHTAGTNFALSQINKKY